MAGRRRSSGRVIKVTSFHPMTHGNWKTKVSVTDIHSYMVICRNLTDDSNIFVKFFYDQETLVAFMDFLKHQDHYTELDD